MRAIRNVRFGNAFDIVIKKFQVHVRTEKQQQQIEQSNEEILTKSAEWGSIWIW